MSDKENLATRLAERIDANLDMAGICDLCAIPRDEESLDVIDKVIPLDELENFLNATATRFVNRYAEDVLAKRAAQETKRTGAEPEWL